ncbi:hypothetical protein HJC23_006094 [Cyclotella cryptica]|uniref:OTU domain-containing protein n=1 Tax=Cyclotella cryptica TaxID=29204 RepID=A0ABD3QKI3_9STRA
MRPNRPMALPPSRRTRRHPPRESTNNPNSSMRRRPSILQMLPLLLLSSRILLQTAGESSTIPRSANRYSNYPDSLEDHDTNDDDHNHQTLPPDHPTTPQHPPWNPSPQIDPTGYLTHLYPRTPGTWEPAANLRGRYGPRSKLYASLSSTPVRIRQVPGDGNCLFHSIAVGLCRVEEGRELDMCTRGGIRELRRRSWRLRNCAVDVLEGKTGGRRRRLFLQGEEYLEARELLVAAASQFDLEGGEYCELMRRESYWGGGPEIVALCNWLQRPIHIYELIPTPKSPTDSDTPSPTHDTSTNQYPQPLSTQFTLRRMACFGSPKFDRREPLHILSADSRFPDVDPRKIRKVGNHFLALFPMDLEEGRVHRGEKREGRLKRRHALIRGGTNEARRKDLATNVKNGDDDTSVARQDGSSKRVERWDGGRGSWSVRSMNPFLVGVEGDGMNGLIHRMERMVFPSFHWLMARLVNFTPISEMR